MTKYLFF